ncbi:MAG: hypothetical protein NVSMB12_06050 [Acidimicrobiales bacterium]
MVDFADDTTTELERKLGPLKVVSLVEAAMWFAAAAFWLTGNRIAQLLLWSVHGTVAMCFAGMVLLIFRKLGWSPQFAAISILSGPMGALLVYQRLRREEPEIRARERQRVLAR